MEIENIKVIRDSIGVAIVPGDEILFNYDGKDVIGKYIGSMLYYTITYFEILCLKFKFLKFWPS